MATIPLKNEKSVECTGAHIHRDKAHIIPQTYFILVKTHFQDKTNHSYWLDHTQT